MECAKEYIKKDKRCFERHSCTLHVSLLLFPLQREKDEILHFVHMAPRVLQLLKGSAAGRETETRPGSQLCERVGK